MAKERIEKTLIILEEAEVRQALAIVGRNDPEERAFRDPGNRQKDRGRAVSAP